jgi:hypothetical protein
MSSVLYVTIRRSLKNIPHMELPISALFTLKYTHCSNAFLFILIFDINLLQKQIYYGQANYNTDKPTTVTSVGKYFTCILLNIYYAEKCFKLKL